MSIQALSPVDKLVNSIDDHNHLLGSEGTEGTRGTTPDTDGKTQFADKTSLENPGNLLHADDLQNNIPKEPLELENKRPCFITHDNRFMSHGRMHRPGLSFHTLPKTKSNSEPKPVVESASSVGTSSIIAPVGPLVQSSL